MTFAQRATSAPQAPGCSVITGATTFYGISQFNQTDKSSEVPAALQVQQITALGRLEPISEVVRLSTPVSLNNDRMAQLLVQRGDRVKAGQAIGVLASRDRIQATLLEAQKQVKVAQANLAQIQAGAKQGEIEAQQAEIARLAAERQGNIASQTATVNRLASELWNAETEYNRYQSLFQEGAISASQRDSKRLTFETAQRNLQEAEAVLNRTRTTTDAVGEILLNISTQENPMSGMAEKMLNFGFETVSLFDSKAFCKKLEFCNQPIQS